MIVSGNITNKTLTAPVLIIAADQPDVQAARPGEAAAVSALLFGLAFVLVLITERLARRTAVRDERVVSVARAGCSDLSRAATAREARLVRGG